MVSKLVTLPRGTSKMPVVTANVSKITLSLGSTTSLNPTTLNFNGVSNLTEPNGYIATIADRRLLQSFTGVGTNVKISQARPFSNTSLSQSVRGQSFSLTAINSTTLFGTNNTLITTITIEGVDSGARVTIPVEISKTVVATSVSAGSTGVALS